MLSPLAACPHASALVDLFDYKDEGHVVIVTNLDENAYEMNMKVANFKRSNMLALLSIWRRCRQLEGRGHVTVPSDLKEDAYVTNIKEEAMHHHYQHLRECPTILDE